MKIEILGTGCPKCEKTYNNVKEAVTSLNIEAEIIKVTNLNDIMSYGVMITPSVVVNGKVKTSGKVPNVEEIYYKKSSKK